MRLSSITSKNNSYTITIFSQSYAKRGFTIAPDSEIANADNWDGKKEFSFTAEEAFAQNNGAIHGTKRE